MRKLRSVLIASNVVTSVLIMILSLFAIYFFIGRNFEYMGKTQQQINNEIISRLDQSTGQDPNQDNIKKALDKAREYNVGIRITTADGRTKIQPLDDDIRMLRLEFGGVLVTEESKIDNGKGTVQLIFFRPFLAGDETVKFFPAFWRLAASSLILAFMASWGVTAVSTWSIKKDLKKVLLITANLVKGSSIDGSKPAAYIEIQPIVEELKALRQIVINKEELKKRMTADYAHELRTPLTTLQSHLEALIDGVWQPTTERFVSCHEEILRLIRLVGDLEKLSKFEDQNIILDKSRFDFNELTQSIALNFEGEMRQRGITFKLSGCPQEIVADRDKISQVIVNLLSNSLKYTPVKGKILVDISGDKDHVYLVINDSGIGIPARDITNVFNRLYRSDASRARATGGAGIGLTIAKSIVEVHRGSIDIVSQEGVGTEITVILPKG